MIKYNSNNINDWDFGTSNIVKVYHNNAVCYYKVVAGETAQTPCYAVVDDITQYQDTEFENIYNKADNKWYKLNNLNEYEEYGVYASGRTECSGGTPTSRLPQGYTEVEYVQNNTQGAYLNLGVKLYETIGNSYQITARYKSQYMPNWSSGEYLQTIINSEGVSTPYYGIVFRYAYNTHVIELAGTDKSDITWTNADNGDGTSALTISSNSTAHADQVPLGLFASYQGNYTTPYRWSNTTIYSMQITLNNELVRDLVPCKRDSDNMVGMYDLVNDVFYYPPNYQSYQLVAGDPTTPTECVTTYDGKLTIDEGYEYQYNGNSWNNVGEVSGSTYPLYYDEIQDPPTQVSFSSMTEAEQYECPYVGLMATINGDLYIFNDNYQWELIPRFEGKWKATYSGGSITTAACDSTSAITETEIAKTGLESVVIGDCVTSIGGWAFQSCSGITSITIPSGVTNIGIAAFQGCTSLTSINIPSGVTSISDYVLSNCPSLTSIDIPNGVTSIGDGAFNICTSLTSVTIPNSVTSIGFQAFIWCSGLRSINIPSGITNIGKEAFSFCTSLTSITVNAITPPTLGTDVFYNTNNCPIYVPSESVSAYQSAWSTYASRIQAIP